MTPERWQQIENLFQAALARDPDQRAAFLDEVCAGDEALRREVESLLEAHQQAGSFIQAPAVEVAAQSLAEDDAQLGVGQRIGPYKIVRRLGAGGMGDVYLAQDSRLGRQVALKLLPEYFTTDKERVWRFQQEARAASALNHPNVATIYEIGETEGAIYIAMEYVEGQTLDTKMSGQPLDSTEILDIAAQVADALEEAHAKGIIHRDIKPGNIMMTPRGQVKVLDFGLAKMAAPSEPVLGTDIATQAKTEPGRVMGTVAYMSPEQALGHGVDYRTDIFSLGVVLYEMATGRRPFAGTTTGETLDAIIHAEPEAVVHFNSNAPTELERIVHKCLEKDRERRYQSAHELLIDLRNLKRDLDSGEGAAARPTSSAEYLISEIKRHRRGVLLTLAALIIAAIAVLAYVVYFVPRSQAITSLAVLPFANASADQNMEYLSDGLSESLINALSQLPHLRVMSRNAVFRYKGRETDAQAAGRELSVQAVLTGRVVQHGDVLSVSIELVNAEDNTHIWGEQYNRQLTDLIRLQSEIARDASRKLRAQLSGSDEQKLLKNYTANVEAYQLYLKGRYHHFKSTQPEIRKGISFYQQAIDADPTYALAYAAMADAYRALPIAGYVASKEAFPQAKAFARRALEIDENLAEAHIALGWVGFFFDWDWNGAESELKRAIELSPNNSDAHRAYAHLLSNLGRHTEAIAEAKRAIELEPLTLITNALEGQFLFYAGREDEAIIRFQKTLEIEPDFWIAHNGLGRVYIRRGMFPEAIAELSKARELSASSTEPVTQLGYALAKSGRREQARATLEELKLFATKKYVPAYSFAMIYNGLGEKEEALKHLERSFQEREVQITFIKIDTRWDELRADPRFQALVRRVGLAP